VDYEWVRLAKSKPILQKNQSVYALTGFDVTFFDI